MRTTGTSRATRATVSYDREGCRTSSDLPRHPVPWLPYQGSWPVLVAGLRGAFFNRHIDDGNCSSRRPWQYSRPRENRQGRLQRRALARSAVVVGAAMGHGVDGGTEKRAQQCATYEGTTGGRHIWRPYGVMDAFHPPWLSFPCNGSVAPKRSDDRTLHGPAEILPVGNPFKHMIRCLPLCGFECPKNSPADWF